MLISVVVLFVCCLAGTLIAMVFLGAHDGGAFLTPHTLSVSAGWMLCFLLTGTLCFIAGYPHPVDVLVLSLLFVACSITDGLRCWLPHTFTLPVLTAGLLWQLLVMAPLWWIPFTGIACGAGAFLLLRLGHYCCGLRGDHLYPGSGDIALMGALGAWLGPAAAFIIQLAGLLLFMGWLLVKHRTEGPLGPFLCLSASGCMLIHALYPFF